MIRVVMGTLLILSALMVIGSSFALDRFQGPTRQAREELEPVRLARGSPARQRGWVAGRMIEPPEGAVVAPVRQRDVAWWHVTTLHTWQSSSSCTRTQHRTRCHPIYDERQVASTTSGAAYVDAGGELLTVRAKPSRFATDGALQREDRRPATLQDKPTKPLTMVIRHEDVYEVGERVTVYGQFRRSAGRWDVQPVRHTSVIDYRSPGRARADSRFFDRIKAGAYITAAILASFGGALTASGVRARRRGGSSVRGAQDR